MLRLIDALRQIKEGQQILEWNSRNLLAMWEVGGSKPVVTEAEVQLCTEVVLESIPMSVKGGITLALRPHGYFDIKEASHYAQVMIDMLDELGVDWQAEADRVRKAKGLPTVEKEAFDAGFNRGMLEAK